MNQHGLCGWRLLVLGVMGLLLGVSGRISAEPLVDADVVFEAKDGVIAVEAEHFFRQSRTDVRQWYLTTADLTPAVTPDGDPNHAATASGGAYLEVLPDTRRTHGDKLTTGQNFSNEPGKMAILHYRVYISTPGRYYVWARIFSTGTEDNGMHVGIDGTWPATGQRMQWTAKGKWAWGSKQRTAKTHGGEPGKLYLDIEKAGLHEIAFCMREDGTEFDKWMLTTAKHKDVAATGPAPHVKSGTLPATFPVTAPPPVTRRPSSSAAGVLPATRFPLANSGFYLDRGKWLAVNPAQRKSAEVSMPFPFASGVYRVMLDTVGEDDGKSRYVFSVDGVARGQFESPLAGETYAEGPAYNVAWEKVTIEKGARVAVKATVGTEDGEEFSRARWSRLTFARADGKPLAALPGVPASPPAVSRPRASLAPLHGERRPAGVGTVVVSGELRQWHKVTLSLDGPFAHELDNQPNPFTDYRMNVTFTHASGTPAYTVPGYFAADGRAAESSAACGTAWRAHLSPDKPGVWTYRVSFAGGRHAALDPGAAAKGLAPFDGKEGTFTVATTDKKGRDLRGRGRLRYVGERYLRFAGTGEVFLKAGADAPETFLAYRDFDGTEARKPNVPLKSWQRHVRDWRPGDPTWQGGKGKGMIGAVNYLSGKGCNVFSFLPYNAGGDGRNVWPFVAYEDKLHYDCSKLDQWQIVFDHATTMGMYLHFKLQETENDDSRGPGARESLDGGNLGVERKLYLRELVARYAHELALNWNLGEENTQTTKQQKDMAAYIRAVDPYDHHIVVHTFPNQQDKVYNALLGKASDLTGASLQNSSIKDTHQQTVKWVQAAEAAGKPWVVAFDEAGNAAHGQPPDPGYEGFAGKDKKGKAVYSLHEVRKQVLWGVLMAGGAGVEYYFGYQFPQSDLDCEDWRSRDRSWDYCRIALDFFRTQRIPVNGMTNMDALVGNPRHDNSRYCFARANALYLVYLPGGGACELDLSDAQGAFRVSWFNPRVGGPLEAGRVAGVKGGARVSLGPPPRDVSEDWLAVIRK